MEYFKLVGSYDASQSTFVEDYTLVDESNEQALVTYSTYEGSYGRFYSDNMYEAKYDSKAGIVKLGEKFKKGEADYLKNKKMYMVVSTIVIAIMILIPVLLNNFSPWPAIPCVVVIIVSASVLFANLKKSSKRFLNSYIFNKVSKGDISRIYAPVYGGAESKGVIIDRSTWGWINPVSIYDDKARMSFANNKTNFVNGRSLVPMLRDLNLLTKVVNDSLEYNDLCKKIYNIRHYVEDAGSDASEQLLSDGERRIVQLDKRLEEVRERFAKYTTEVENAKQKEDAQIKNIEKNQRELRLMKAIADADSA